MSGIKKIIALLLAMTLCVLVAGCGYVSERPLADNDKGSSDEVKAEYTVKAEKFAAPDGYKVIYPEGNEQLRQAASKLVTYLTENDVKVEIASDTSAKTDKEILVGNTNRRQSTLGDTQYAVSIVDNKLVFESGHFNGAIKAVLWFISLPFENGKINTLTGEYDVKTSVEREDGTYNLVWADEFDGDTLDPAKWELTSSISAESSFKLSREPEALSVSNGCLNLTVRRWFDPENDQIQAIAPYTVESKEHINFQYGYLEMRARIPFGAGAWPSLWLSGACSTDAVVTPLYAKGDIYPANFSAEFDIIEYTSLQPNLHKWFYDEAANNVSGVSNKHSSLGAVMKPLPTSNLRLDANQSYVYQIIGFEWTPKDMTVYINGDKYFNYNWTESVQLDGYKDMTDFRNPAFIRLNNHLEPKKIPSDFSTLPGEFVIDYVRLYQKPNTGGIWLAE